MGYDPALEINLVLDSYYGSVLMSLAIYSYLLLSTLPPPAVYIETEAIAARIGTMIMQDQIFQCTYLIA